LKTLSLQLNPEIRDWRFSAILLPLIGIGFVFSLSIVYVLKGFKGVLMALGVAFLLQFAVIFFFIFFFAPAYKSAGPGPSAGIKLLQSRTIGSYDISILQTETAADLNHWLSTHHFRQIPQNGIAIVDDYISRNWFFIAARLTRNNDGLSTPHPLLIDFEVDSPTYPMQLTALSGNTVYLELYVVAAEEAEVQNYNRTFDPV
jgi:hypothetical protein